MRILFISNYYKPAFAYGGPTTASSRLCEALVRQGARVTVLTTHANGTQIIDVPEGAQTDVDGVTVYYYPLKWGGLGFFYSPGLAKAVNEHVNSADFVILQGVWSYIIRPAGEAILRARKPYAIPMHGKFMKWAFAQKHLKKKIYFVFILRKYLHQAAFLHCTIDSEAHYLDSLGVDTPKVILPYGVNLDNYDSLPPPGYFRNKFKISDDSFVLLYLGRLHKEKGPDIAIGALQELNNPPVHLILAGSDMTGMLPDLLKYANELGISNQIHYAGLLNEREVLQAFSDSDLLVVPSRVNENFGMTAVEAMAGGLPVIVSSGIPYGKLIEDYGAGKQVGSNIDEFHKALRESLSGKVILNKMSKNGKRLVREHFDVDQIAQRLLKEIHSIVSSCPSSSEQWKT